MPAMMTSASARFSARACTVALEDPAIVPLTVAVVWPETVATGIIAATPATPPTMPGANARTTFEASALTKTAPEVWTEPPSSASVSRSLVAMTTVKPNEKAPTVTLKVLPEMRCRSPVATTVTGPDTTTVPVVNDAARVLPEYSITETMPPSAMPAPATTPTAQEVGSKWSVAVTVMPPIAPSAPIATVPPCPMSACVSPEMSMTEIAAPIAPRAIVMPIAYPSTVLSESAITKMPPTAFVMAAVASMCAFVADVSVRTRIWPAIATAPTAPVTAMTVTSSSRSAVTRTAPPAETTAPPKMPASTFPEIVMIAMPAPIAPAPPATAPARTKTSRRSRASTSTSASIEWTVP